MAIGTPNAELVRATHCEGCNRAESHVRRRRVVEAGTRAAQHRFLCAHCAGGMVEIGHKVEPFTVADRAEFETWMNRRSAPVLSVASVVRLQEEA